MKKISQKELRRINLISFTHKGVPLLNNCGEKHWNWKGGVSLINQIIRQSTEYKLWREKVFEKGKYTCIRCKKGGRLNVDHVKSLSTIISENKIKTMSDARSCKILWDIDNGRILCINCHKKNKKLSREK